MIAINLRHAAIGFGGFLVTSAMAEELGPWPRTIPAQPARVVPATAPEGVAFAYETASFRLFSYGKIDPQLLVKFATVIESVPRLLKAVPLPLWTPPPGDKYRIMLCRDEQNYEDSGGPPGSMGIYDGRKRQILIRADVFLRPPSEAPSRLQPKPDENLLVHELTHLGMHDLLWRTPPWFNEGIAEYIAAGHVGGGAYDFSRIDLSIRDRIRRHLPSANGPAAVLPSLESIVNTTSDEWIEGNNTPDTDAVYLPYAASLLLIHYQLHGKDRINAVSDYLKAVLAYRNKRQPLPKLELGPLGEVEKRIAKYWQPKGLAISFETNRESGAAGEPQSRP